MGLMTLNIVTIRIMTESAMTLGIKIHSTVKKQRRMPCNRILRTMILSIGHSV